MCSYYTDFRVEEITLTLPEEVAHWARIKAAEEHTSVSRLVGKMLETQMRQTEDYKEAYLRWKNLPPMNLDAKNRLSREQAHERR